MKWDEVEIALQFLENPTDEITLQVPYHCDITRVQDWLMTHKQGLGIMAIRDKALATNVGTIHIESTQDIAAGVGRKGPYFLIPRANGDCGDNLIDHGE
jgi:hypothetical protein